ncbi:MAG: RidA family protein [Bacteroidetes bacterium]|nr:MAG: RidA family protein [Bacteroidota bacterium]
MQILDSPNIPPANGHYSPAIKSNGMLYLSGQLPIEQGTRKIPDTIEEQTDLCLRNIELIIREAGCSKSDIVQMRLYISNIHLWDKVNERYAAFFEEHKPVRSVIPTRDLHFGCLIEVEAVAELPH